MKLKTRNNIIQKLAGSLWDADATTLCMAALALVYSILLHCWAQQCPCT